MNKASAQVQKQNALAALQNNCVEEARRLLEKLCRKNRSDAEAWYMLGAANGMLGLYDKSEKCNRRVIAILPAHYQAHSNLGAALREQGKPAEALQHFTEALRIRPDYLMAYSNMASTLRDLRRFGEAIACYQKTLEIDPRQADAHYHLGDVYWLTGNLDTAVQHFQETLRLDPGFVKAATSIAGILKSRKQYEEALAVLSPYLSGAAGEIPVAAVLAFAGLCRYVGRCDEATERLEALRSESGRKLSEEDRVAIHFHLGALYDGRGDFENAFANYQTGNRLRPRSSPDEEFPHELLETVVAAFSADFLGRAPRAENASELPVFIVGMPRSGTTLTEQILCSHPMVAGGGELKFLREAIEGMQEVIGSQRPYPHCLVELTQAHGNRIAEGYLGRLEECAGGQAARITDKLPWNFWHLGMVDLLFPGARVIHCTREPLDTCVSIYFQNFVDGHEFGRDLREIGRVYNIYRQLMDHWRSVLEYPMLEVDYEELVADPETSSRRLIEFCGLPWDDQCLQFHDNDRLVMTASADQVRRPIYKTSIQRWKNYQAFLGPLISELENYQRP